MVAKITRTPCELHSGIIEQFENISNQLESLKDSFTKQFQYNDKSLETAKLEMDRRLDSMNHLSDQLREQREETRTKLVELVGSFVPIKEFDLRLDKFETKVESKIDALAKDLTQMQETASEKKGRRVWADHILTVIIASATFLIVHWLAKF